MSERGRVVLSLPWATKHDCGLWRIEGEFGFFEIAPYGGPVTAFVPENNAAEEFMPVGDERAIDRVIEHREKLAAENSKRLQEEFIKSMERQIAKNYWPSGVGVDLAKNNSSSQMNYSYVKRTRTN